MSEKFRTIYDRVRVYSVPGDTMANDYALSVEKDGTKRLKVTGKHSLYNEIQSYKSSCDIKCLIERYLNIGDPAILNRKPAAYMDVTNVPQTYAEILQFNINTKNMYDSLTAEQKAKFDNSVDKFVASIGSKTWYENIGVVFDKPEVIDPEVIDKEVVDNA